MKSVIALCLLVFLQLSCSDPTVDDNIRVLVKGKVQDVNGNPLDDAMVHVYLEGNSSSLLSGSGLSEDDGTFSLTSIFGSNDNLRVNVSKSDSYSSYSYLVGIRDYIPNDLTFDLQTIQLSKIGFLEINVSREANSENALDLSVFYTSAECIQIFEGQNIIDDFSFCFEPNSFNRTLGDNFPNFSRTIVVPLNSEVSISYNINEGETLTETIEVNQENQVYEILY
jgi:hypothetical protein